MFTNTLISNLRAWHNRGLVSRDLSAMSDRQFADIGITQRYRRPGQRPSGARRRLRGALLTALERLGSEHHIFLICPCSAPAPNL